MIRRTFTRILKKRVTAL